VRRKEISLENSGGAASLEKFRNLDDYYARMSDMVGHRRFARSGFLPNSRRHLARASLCQWQRHRDGNVWPRGLRWRAGSLVPSARQLGFWYKFGRCRGHVGTDGTASRRGWRGGDDGATADLRCNGVIVSCWIVTYVTDSTLYVGVYVNMHARHGVRRLPSDDLRGGWPGANVLTR
jgi:hypothetical protein